MTDFVSTWNEESFLTTPVAPLGLIAMRGTEDMGDKVNKWLLKWRKYTEETLPGDMSTTPGMGREDFLVRATCPRFGNGEGKGLIKDSVRGLDLYILCDVGAYNCTYSMYGHEVPMSPDDHYMDLKRTIAAVGGKAKRITVIMPLLYGGRQHRRSAPCGCRAKPCWGSKGQSHLRSPEAEPLGASQYTVTSAASESSLMRSASAVWHISWYSVYDSAS